MEEVIVIDYGSKKPIKIRGVKVIRCENGEFNKAHALNIGIKAAECEYIMTLDADILIYPGIYNELYVHLDNNTFCCGTNVRRIEKEYVSKTYQETLVQSYPWGREDRSQIFNQTNGGFQLYPKKFWEDIGGIPESLGVLWGAEDNYMWYMARLRNLTIADISFPIFHVEHTKSKSKSMREYKKEQLDYVAYKGRWLNDAIEKKITENPESFVGRKKPCLEIYNAYVKEYRRKQKILQDAVNNGEKSKNILLEEYTLEKLRPSILIAIINNQDQMNTKFVYSLINLYMTTIKNGYDVDIENINLADVPMMRNFSLRSALGNGPRKKKYDYVVQLDTDHSYNPNFITDFIEKMSEMDIPILTGLTSNKSPPLHNTQYIELKEELNTPDNYINSSKPSDEVVRIEASGPVGMVIATKALAQLKFPYYLSIYKEDKPCGEDIYFCQKLKEKNIPMYCWLKYSFPHQRIIECDREKVIL